LQKYTLTADERATSMAANGTSLPTFGNATSSSAIQGSTDTAMSHPVRYPEAIKVAFVQRMRLVEHPHERQQMIMDHPVHDRSG
jgi:hypothetical protein